MLNLLIILLCLASLKQTCIVAADCAMLSSACLNGKCVCDAGFIRDGLLCRQICKHSQAMFNLYINAAWFQQNSLILAMKTKIVVEKEKYAPPKNVYAHQAMRVCPRNALRVNFTGDLFLLLRLSV